MENQQEYTDSETVPRLISDQFVRVDAELTRLHQMLTVECGMSADDIDDPVIPISWTHGIPVDQFGEAVFGDYKSAASEFTMLRRGRLFCYHCRSISCTHSKPADRGAVFAGYADNGTPRWLELFNYLLEIDDRRIDTLFSDAPPVLSRVVERKKLITEQLVAYGRNSMTYRILAQLVSGYFMIRGKRFAMTVQVVETADHRLHFQLIVPDDVRCTLVESPDRIGKAHERIYESLQVARTGIDRIDSRWQYSTDRKERQKIVQRIFTILRHLGNSLEQKGRQYHRRTNHAAQRSREQRPVHKAQDDLQHAGLGDFFLDTTTQSVVILGKNGRSHVFNRKGTLITSLVLPGKELAQRQKRRRYTRLTPIEVATFRTALVDSMNNA